MVLPAGTFGASLSKLTVRQRGYVRRTAGTWSLFSCSPDINSHESFPDTVPHPLSFHETQSPAKCTAHTIPVRERPEQIPASKHHTKENTDFCSSNRFLKYSNDKSYCDQQKTSKSYYFLIYHACIMAPDRTAEK
jgi:hypothetical protein